MHESQKMTAEAGPQLVTVVDLGEGNLGGISAEGMTTAEREQFVQDLVRPEYHKRATNRWICIDGRPSEDPGASGEHYADPQTAGGVAVTRSAAYYMVTPGAKTPLSQTLATETDTARAQGLKPVVHGHCGALAELVKNATPLRNNALHRTGVASRAWVLAGELGIQGLVAEEDIDTLITVGAENAQNDELFDVDLESAVKVQTDHGSEYENLQGEHTEAGAVLMTAEGAFDKHGFIADHPREDGMFNEAFGAALGEYKKTTFEKGIAAGKTERECALETTAMVLWNIGVSKVLTAEENGNGEALPFVVVR